MRHYVNELIDSLLIKVHGTTKTPGADDLLSESKGEKFNKEQANKLCIAMAKGLFVCKCARLDIQLPMAVLCIRVKEPRRLSWDK